jgi:hypothetical protein
VPTNQTNDDVLQQIANIRTQMNRQGTEQLWVITDQNLVERVAMGLLDNGDFGISLGDPSGNTQELLPGAFETVPGALTTSSTSAVVLAGGPAVTAHIGASGDCVVQMSTLITTAGGSGQAWLDVDGSIVDPASGAEAALVYAVNSSQSSVSCQLQFSTYSGTTLAPGAHTFKIRYQSPYGTSTSFYNSYLGVQPI